MPLAPPTSAVATLALTIVAACLPLPSTAQVVRCTDPATGKVTYTDGDCGRGQSAREVEARKTPQEIQQEREQAAEALQRKQERQQQEQQERLERIQRQSTTPAPAAAPPSAAVQAADPALSAECQRARKNLQDVLATLGRGMYDEQARLDTAQRQADLACLSAADYARAESARASRQASPVPYSVPYPVPYPAPHSGAYPRPQPRPHTAPPSTATPGRPAPQPGRDITHCNVFRCYDRQGNTYPR